MKFFILLCLFPQFAFAHGGGEAEGAKIGKGIIAYDKHDGFKLSTQSQSRMKFSYKKVESTGSISIPKEAVVLALSEVHVYTHINDFFKTIDVKISSKNKDFYVVSSPDLKVGLEIVVKGVNFLRVIDMDLNVSEEKGEDHSEEGDHHD